MGNGGPRAGQRTRARRNVARAPTMRAMPIYTYRCASCGDRDVRQPITADSLTECPECQGPVRKVITAPGVTFNGSGFYRTDSVPRPPKKARAPKRP